MPGIDVARLSSKDDYQQLDTVISELRTWLNDHSFTAALANLPGLAEKLRELWPPLKAAKAQQTLVTWRILPGVGGWAAGGWDGQVMQSASCFDEVERAKGPPEPQLTPEQVRDRKTPQQMIEQHNYNLHSLLTGAAGVWVTDLAWADFRSTVTLYAKELLAALDPGGLAGEGAAPQRKPQPNWDGVTLWFEGVRCCTYSRSAPHQGTILQSFEELLWPARIDDPLDRGKLKEAVDNLRKKLKESKSPIMFSMAGEGVSWRRI